LKGSPGLLTSGFTLGDACDRVSLVSTIKAILEADADGTLHLPLPTDLRQGKIDVTATLKPVGGTKPGPQPHFGCLAGKIQLAPDFDEPLEDFREYTQ